MSERSWTGVAGAAALGLTVTGAAGLLAYLLLRDSEEEYQLTSRQVRETVGIPRQSVGIVIGRQGSTLREIEAKTNTRVKVRDEGEENRSTAEIRGTPDNIQEAKLLIASLIENQPKIILETIEVPDSAVSRIIGRKGEVVKDITRTSRCKVTFEDRTNNVSRKIYLKGTALQISEAKDLIDRKVYEIDTVSNYPRSSRGPSRTRQPLFLNHDGSDSEDSSDCKDLELKREELRVCGSDNCLEVFVSSVTSPSLFWVQKLGPSSIQLDKLTQEMTYFYAEEEKKTSPILSDPNVGALVAAKFPSDCEGSYYRAKVESLEEDSYDPTCSLATLLYVDYGDRLTESISSLSLRPLLPTFLSLPQQAMPATLHSVGPQGSTEWSSEATEAFISLSYCGQWKQLWAKVHWGSGTQGEPYSTELWDTGALPGQDINIGEELIKMNLAVMKVEVDSQ